MLGVWAEKRGVKNESKFFLELSERRMTFPYFRQETVVGEAGSVKGMGVRAEGGV